MVRQDAFLHADHVDVGEFQALGAVQGHQHHGVPLQLLFFVIVHVAVAQHDFIQEAGQRRLLGFRL